MTQYAAGWYPDGSGRFAQRYYDGAHWTADVRDHAGRAGSDPVPGVTVDRSTTADDIATTSTETPTPPPAPSSWPTASGSSTSSASWSSSPSASRYQFGPAPSHASAYASDPSGAPEPAPDRVRGRVSVPPVRWLLPVAAAVTVAVVALVLGFWV